MGRLALGMNGLRGDQLRVKETLCTCFYFYMNILMHVLDGYKRHSRFKIVFLAIVYYVTSIELFDRASYPHEESGCSRLPVIRTCLIQCSS